MEIVKYITRQEAEKDERLYPLMNFMMAWGRDISNWEYIKSLEMYEKRHPVITLYRGLDYNPSFQPLSRCESWTRSYDIAKAFGSTVIERDFTPEDIVFDTRFLAPDLFTNFQWQQEVIVKPCFDFSRSVQIALGEKQKIKNSVWSTLACPGT